jgi:hypothetical protein
VTSYIEYCERNSLITWKSVLFVTHGITEGCKCILLYQGIPQQNKEFSIEEAS